MLHKGLSARGSIAPPPARGSFLSRHMSNGKRVAMPTSSSPPITPLAEAPPKRELSARAARLDSPTALLQCLPYAECAAPAEPRRLKQTKTHPYRGLCPHPPSPGGRSHSCCYDSAEEAIFVRPYVKRLSRHILRTQSAPFRYSTDLLTTACLYFQFGAKE